MLVNKITTGEVDDTSDDVSIVAARWASWQESGGLWCFIVSTAGADDKQLKTVAVERLVLIYPTLRDIGFVGYAKEWSSIGEVSCSPRYGPMHLSNIQDDSPDGLHGERVRGQTERRIRTGGPPVSCQVRVRCS